MSLEDRLAAAGQGRLAEALARLDGAERDRLRGQVAALDLDLVGRLVGDLVAVDGPPELGRIEPLAPEDVILIPRSEADRERARGAAAAGTEALRDGRVAAVLLAGGQGTRLGFDGPKGAFPFAPITGTPLFAHHAAKIAALRERHAAPIPWYVLTSPQNDGVTRAFFADHGHFGLDPASVRFVIQGTLPAVDRESTARSCSRPRTGWRCRPTGTAACCRRCGRPAPSTRWRPPGSRRSSPSRSTTRCCRSAGRT